MNLTLARPLMAIVVRVTSFLATVTVLCLSASLSQAAPLRGHYTALCAQGAVPVQSAGAPSAHSSVISFPGCTVTVYAAGTESVIPLYSDQDGTSKANPFVADSISAFYDFYADTQFVDIVLSGAGIGVPFVLRNQEVTSLSLISRDISLSQFSCAGNGVTNDTACLQRALIAADRARLPLYVPPGEYAICSVSLKTSGSIAILGEGPFESRFVRHSSCLQASTDMIEITDAGWVAIHDLGFDMLTDGSNFSKAEVNLTGVGGADIYNDYFTHAQAVAVQYTRSNNLKFHDNYCYQNWWFCLSVASGGATAAPAFNSGFIATGNLCVQTPWCEGFSFFVKDIVVARSTHTGSGTFLVQTPNAHAEITGNTYAGLPTYGCISARRCGTYSLYGSISGEGVGDVDIGSNIIHDTYYGIYLQGSSLQIPEGGKLIQLPIFRSSVHDNKIYTTSNYSILVSAAASDGAPGSQISITGNVSTNVSSGPNVTAADSTIMTNNVVEVANGDCTTLSNVTHFKYTNNTNHNCGRSGSGRGLWMVSKGVKDGYVYNNTFINDNGKYLMSGGVSDETMTDGEASLIRHCGNTVVGESGSKWNPRPGVPTNGTWNEGDCIENFASAPNESLGWKNVKAGAPGTWVVTGTIFAPHCVSTASPAQCGAAASGFVAIRTGQNSITVATTALQANSRITLTPDSSLGTALGIRCERGQGNTPAVSERSDGKSFTITAQRVLSNYSCYSYSIDNTP